METVAPQILGNSFFRCFFRINLKCIIALRIDSLHSMHIFCYDVLIMLDTCFESSIKSRLSSRVAGLSQTFSCKVENIMSLTVMRGR